MGFSKEQLEEIEKVYQQSFKRSSSWSEDVKCYLPGVHEMVNEALEANYQAYLKECEESGMSREVAEFWWKVLDEHPDIKEVKQEMFDEAVTGDSQHTKRVHLQKCFELKNKVR